MRCNARMAAGSLLCALSSIVHVHAQTAVLLTPKASIYISPTADAFEVYLAAAMAKKEVPATLVDKVDYADFTLKAEGSVAQLIGRDETVLWSYSIAKARDARNRQSVAESIAKRLKSDFFRK